VPEVRPSVRVLLDATAIPPSVGGVGRYLEGLVPELLAAGIDLYVAITPGLTAVFPDLPADRVHVLGRWSSSRPLRMMWEQVGLPLLARRLGAAVIHSPHYTFPLLSGRRRVVTVHDGTFFSHPGVHTRLKAVFFRSWLRLLARSSAVVVSPSIATAEELGRYTGLDRRRVVIAPHGVDGEVFRPPTDDEIARLRSELGISVPWIAFLGTLEPRKNVPALVDGFVRAVRDDPNAPALVLAGGKGWDPRIDAALQAVPSSLTVLRPGYVDRDLLPALLGGARLVAYPSLGEGFGLPVAEALACGAAVLTTRKLSLPEVGGDAVAYCETDAESIAEGLRSALSPSEQTRLRSGAAARAALFTWRRSADAHVEAFTRAAGEAEPWDPSGG